MKTLTEEDKRLLTEMDAKRHKTIMQKLIVRKYSNLCKKTQQPDVSNIDNKMDI